MYLPEISAFVLWTFTVQPSSFSPISSNKSIKVLTQLKKLYCCGQKMWTDTCPIICLTWWRQCYGVGMYGCHTCPCIFPLITSPLISFMSFMSRFIHKKSPEMLSDLRTPAGGAVPSFCTNSLDLKRGIWAGWSGGSGVVSAIQAQ